MARKNTGKENLDGMGVPPVGPKPPRKNIMGPNELGYDPKASGVQVTNRQAIKGLVLSGGKTNRLVNILRDHLQGALPSLTAGRFKATLKIVEEKGILKMKWLKGDDRLKEVFENGVQFVEPGKYLHTRGRGLRAGDTFSVGFSFAKGAGGSIVTGEPIKTL